MGTIERSNRMKVSAQAKVGIVTVLALLTLAMMIVWKGDLLLRASGYTLVGVFSNVAGLMEGSDVRYRGYKIGKTLKVEPTPTNTFVSMNIDSKIKVPQNSGLRIAFDGLIGQKYLEIMPGTAEAFLKDGDKLRGTTTLGLVDFIDVGTKNLQESKRILTSFREISEDPDIQMAIRKTLLNVEDATTEITAMSRNIGSLAKDLRGVTNNLNQVFGSQEGAELNQTFKLLKGSMLDFAKITSAFGDVAGDPNFASDLKGLIANAKDAAAEIREAAKRTSKALERFNK